MANIRQLIRHPAWQVRPAGNHNPHPVSTKLINSARQSVEQVLNDLATHPDGLTQAEAASRLQRYGPNEVASEKAVTPLTRLWNNVKNPLVILLSILGVISYLTGDVRATLIIFLMVGLGIILRYFQEQRADNAAAKLRAMITTTTAVMRDGQEVEVSLHELVPGDIVQLAVGDMVPADLRLIQAKDLFINQSALTGEALPVEKDPNPPDDKTANPLEMADILFLGSSVVSGVGSAAVVSTGGETYFGSLAASITGERQPTSFDQGINSFTWLMIGFIGVMVPAVFLLNGIFKGNWMEAFLFALAVAVGLTPEMLPMIVTVNLSRGAIDMSRQKVIVKRLNSIQNLGAMDTLCTDKTGTITDGKIVLQKHLDARGNDSELALHYAYLNSYFETGLKNVMDQAILDHAHLKEHLGVEQNYRKIDEIPFDFTRRRLSVVVEDQTGRNFLICKGAIEEILALCTKVQLDGQMLAVEAEHDAHRRQRVHDLNSQGYRVVALAYKEVDANRDLQNYSVADETDLILLGFLAFLDPPKESAREALNRLAHLNVAVKILTGDNDAVAASICSQVGLPAERILIGSEIDGMDEGALAEAAEAVSVFAKLDPSHKERIIRALQKKGHVVGFMGDGINDAPALKAGDVGISVDTAVDIAKESSDIILLENSLLTLEQGVISGRRVFGNITKYIRMAASSNFGNMFSVLGASIFLPFLPMQPVQVLLNNLLYDFSQTPIPSDQVDEDWLTRPRKWEIGNLRRFILFIGPLSSIFDYLTFLMMIYIFGAWTNPALFQTGWFVESVFTQTLIIHVIRTRQIPFLQSRASTPLLLTSILVVCVAAVLPYTPLGAAFGFVALPPLYWPLLAIMLIAYITLTQFVKTWFYQRFGE
jgi:Mg2+-importing ATPase